MHITFGPFEPSSIVGIDQSQCVALTQSNGMLFSLVAGISVAGC